MNYLQMTEDPDWLVDVRSWVCGQLGIPGAACPELQPVRIMPWAAVYRLEAEGRQVFFKACAPTQGHEPALVSYLARRHAACSLPVLAADLNRGWLLLPDGGDTLSHMQFGQMATFTAWIEIFPLVASLQRAAETDIEQMAQIGVPQKGLDDLLAVYSRLMDEPWRLRIDHPEGLDAAEAGALKPLLPRLERAFAGLAAVGLPESLVHEEPHDRHVFVRVEGDARRYAFYDWGDACIGQPLMWATLPLRDLAEDFPKALTPEVWNQLTAAYLNAWLDVAPFSVLQPALHVSMIAACLTRAQTWMMVEDVYADMVPQPVMDFYPRAMAYWLRRVRDWLVRFEAGLPPLP